MNTNAPATAAFPVHPPVRTSTPAVDQAADREPAPSVLDEDTVQTLQSLRGQRGPSLFPELVEMFRQSEAQQLASIGRGIATHDVNAVADPVHSYGGNAAILGGLEIRKISMTLEDAAREGNWDEVALCWNRINPARQRFFAALDKLGGDAS